MAVDVRVLLAVLLGLCWRPPPAVEGVTFSLTGYDSIPTDGSGRVLITDINPDGDNNVDRLICRSEIDTFTSTDDSGGNWFLNRTERSTDTGDRIMNDDPRGWTRNRALDSNHLLVRLRRGSATALEGVFTCDIRDDNNTPSYVGVYYPISSVTASIDVVSGRLGTFRVRCDSSGGRALSMSVTGPDAFSEDLNSIQAVGTPQRRGSDSFSDSTDIISEGSDGQTYVCTASNGVSSDPTDSVELRVANPPTITSLRQLSATSVRVTWSRPSGGAPVTGYIVHYRTGNTVGTESSSSTTADITGLTNGLTYTISVEATSQHLSGESGEMMITPEPPPPAPSGLMVDGVDDISVTVSWGAVDGADSYTVTFTKTIGANQEGLCLPAMHVVNVPVDAPSTSTSRISENVDVGEMLAGDDTTMLRAYTTYSITVVAVNDVTGSSGNSVAIRVTTAQIGATAAPRNVMATFVNSTVISVQWIGLDPCRHANGRIESYRVQYTASGVVNSENVPGEYNVMNAMTSLTGLTPFTNYSIEVAAVNMEGEVGVYSDPLVRRTLEDTPGPVMINEPFPSFFKISITWSPPERPNGIITEYEVSYEPSDSSQPLSTGLETSFTTPSNLDLGTEFIFSVRASTSVGFGETASVTVSTLTRPPAVQGVEVSFDGTSVTVSWDVLIIPDFPVTTYTVVYSQLSEQEDEEMSVEVSDNSTVISALNSDNIYQFEVFATVTVDGTPLQGERSSPVYLTRALVVQGVDVAVFNDTAVTVSWNSIQSYPVDFYTVVYSPVPQRRRRQDGGEMSAVFPPPATSGVIGGLDPATDYQFQVFANVTVDGVTLQGEGSAPVRFGIDDSRRSTGSGNTGAIAGGVIVAIILALVVVGILVVVIYIWMKRRDRDSKSSYKPSSEQPDVPLAAVHYSKPSDHTSNGEKTTEPKITRFPEDKHVVEGEKVVFRVKVTGIPQPKVTWYHNGEEVVGDYSKELLEDGSLTMPSAEAKHSGVYQLVAMNKAGSMEREVKLFVKQEGQPSPYVARKQIHFAPIPVDEFGNYVAKCHSNDNRDFRDQYTELDNDADHPTTIGSSPNLKLLNRFANITVYDNNRIMLRPIDGHSDCQRDFINACYVDGYKLRNKFIATQGPLPKTVVDFWRLVWQEKPPTIVMVTNLKEGTRIKCQQYWPESGSKSFGPFQVTISDHQTLADYTTRSLLVQLTGSSGHPLKVTQFHFTAWPDHGVPDYATPILAFHRKIKKQHRPSKGPLLIHCSAGVGRTGTLITIDRVLDQIEKERLVDIAGVIQQLRNQRMKMVQNPEQYIFINDAILEAVTCGDTQIAASDLRRTIQKLSRRDPQTHSTGFESQFKVLDQVSPNPREVLRDKALENPNKNRSEDFLPSDRWRVVLKGEVDDYIHAVVVNGYKQQRAFIIAQSPMQSTVRDFWKMVYDRKCGVIVMLSALVEAGKEVCHQYWPKSGMMPVGEFTVDCIGEENMEGFIIRTLSVLHNKSGKAQQVIQLHMTNWAPDGRCSNLTSIVDVIGEMSKIQRRTGNHPILIHCSDTVSRSGMFCAIATTIERCKTEGVVDVFQVVKALRVQKPGAVRTVSQYHTLFEAVLVYLDSFDTYGNFQDL